VRFDGTGGAWTQRHRQWLAGVDLGQRGAQVTLLDYISAIDAPLVRRDTLEATIADLVPDSPWATTVARLRCLRGIDTLTAVGLCAAVGNFGRFARAGHVMRFLGTGPVRAQLRPDTPPGPDHQVRLRPRPPPAGRGCLALPPPAGQGPGAQAPPGRPARAHARDLLAGPTAPAPLEVLAFTPATAQGIAYALGVGPRTTQRLVHTLLVQRYIERVDGPSEADQYLPTVRLPALAAQLARRLPLVRHGEHAVRALHDATGLTACLAVPSYGDVVVLARAGPTAPWKWDLLPAADTAAGHVLLAYRESWRHSHDSDGTLEQRAADVREHDCALVPATQSAELASLAVPVPDRGAPIAALALAGPTRALVRDSSTRCNTRPHGWPTDALAGEPNTTSGQAVPD
jgi:DNA-binding IclR family transcriptional regulator